MIGSLGRPLGEVVSIEGIAADEDYTRRKADAGEILLRVLAVNGKSLKREVVLNFHPYEGAEMKNPSAGMRFKYFGYETGGFSGIPEAAFVYVPRVPTSGHYFTTSFVILRDDNGSAASMKTLSQTPRSVAEIKLQEMRWRKPPLVELYFDILLRNDRTEPRWFLLPSNLGPRTRSVATKGGVDGLEVFAPRSTGRVILGHFLGTGGFHALLLPGHAELRLRIFPISFWGDLPDRVQIDLVVAKSLTIGGERARAWFGVSPMCSARADVAENPLSQTRMLRSRHTPDRKEVETLIEEESRSTLEVFLKRTE